MQVNVRRAESPNVGLGNQRGMTLIELVVAIFISIIILAAGFTALVTTEKASRANGQTVDTQQNARIAMDLIARDIRGAGMGMIGAIGACPTAVVPADQTPAGADTGSDNISLVTPTGSGTWTLTGPVGTGGAGFIQLGLSSGAAGAVANMQSMGMGNGSILNVGGAVSGTVSAFDVNAGTINLSNAVPPPATFPTGTPVYLLQCITYSIGTTTAACGGGTSPCLLRGGVPVVDGIESIQFAYGCDGCVGAINGGVPDGVIDDQNGNNGFDQADFVTNSLWATGAGTIKLVQISIVARQLGGEQGFGEGPQAGISSPPTLQVSDHAMNLAGTQQFRRRLLTRTIELRNMRL
jgi:type IV pilus assembly protein PilW